MQHKPNKTTRAVLCCAVPCSARWVQAGWVARSTLSLMEHSSSRALPLALAAASAGAGLRACAGMLPCWHCLARAWSRQPEEGF